MSDVPAVIDAEVVEPTSEPGTLSALELQWKFAQRVAKTEFVPQAFRNRADAVLAAICFGQELGIGPMQSLQSINVIQGKPSLSPEAMRSRVFAAGHTIETVKYDDEAVILKGTRGDSGATAEVSWTMKDAQRAKLVGKDSWKNYPRAMLLARATSELCRLLFPDAIAGASYTPEELHGENPPFDDSDLIDVEPEDAQPTTAPADPPVTPPAGGSAPHLKAG